MLGFAFVFLVELNVIEGISHLPKGRGTITLTITINAKTNRLFLPHTLEVYVSGARTYVSGRKTHVLGARTYVLGAET